MTIRIVSSFKVLIRKQGARSESIYLTGDTEDQVAEFIKGILKPHVDPFAGGKVTSISVINPVIPAGAVNFSFRSLEPAEVKLLVTEALVSTKPKTVST